MSDEFADKIPVTGMAKIHRIIYVIDEKTGKKTELTTIVDDNPRSRTYCTRKDCECLEDDTPEGLELKIAEAGIEKTSNAVSNLITRKLE